MSSDWLEPKVRWLQLQRLSRAFSAGLRKNKGAALVLEHPRDCTAHAQLKHRDSSCCNGSCLIVRTATRRVPAAVHEGENEKEKEKTKRSTRFPNGRLLLETTTCSSSTRYARIRLARTRKGSDCRHSTGGGAPGPCACLADFPVGGV